MYAPCHGTRRRLTHSDHDIHACRRRIASPNRARQHLISQASDGTTVRSGIRVLPDLHDQQVHAYEVVSQASRALPVPRTGPLEWVQTLDGYQLAGSHLPDPGHRA
jgi:hypothetical protein